MIATACAAIALAWLLVYRPTLSQSPLTSQRIGIFTSVAVYPVMDVGLIYAATIAWVGAAGGIPRRTIGLFCLSTAAYGVANCLQFGNLVLDGFSTPLTNLFWVLSDVMASLAAAYILGRASSVSEARRRTSPLMLWLDRVPYAFVFIATGLTVMDLVIHRGRIDIVATLSILLASATLALQHWWNQSHN